MAGVLFGYVHLCFCLAVCLSSFCPLFFMCLSVLRLKSAYLFVCSLSILPFRLLLTHLPSFVSPPLPFLPTPFSSHSLLDSSPTSPRPSFILLPSYSLLPSFPSPFYLLPSFLSPPPFLPTPSFSLLPSLLSLRRFIHPALPICLVVPFSLVSSNFPLISVDISFFSFALLKLSGFLTLSFPPGKREKK